MVYHTSPQNRPAGTVVDPSMRFGRLSPIPHATSIHAAFEQSAAATFAHVPALADVSAQPKAAPWWRKLLQSITAGRVLALAALWRLVVGE